MNQKFGIFLALVLSFVSKEIAHANGVDFTQIEEDCPAVFVQCFVQDENIVVSKKTKRIFVGYKFYRQTALDLEGFFRVAVIGPDGTMINRVTIDDRSPIRSMFIEEDWNHPITNRPQLFVAGSDKVYLIDSGTGTLTDSHQVTTDIPGTDPEDIRFVRSGGPGKILVASNQWLDMSTVTREWMYEPGTGTFSPVEVASFNQYAQGLTQSNDGTIANLYGLPSFGAHHPPQELTLRTPAGDEHRINRLPAPAKLVGGTRSEFWVLQSDTRLNSRFLHDLCIAKFIVGVSVSQVCADTNPLAGLFTHYLGIISAQYNEAADNIVVAATKGSEDITVLMKLNGAGDIVQYEEIPFRLEALDRVGKRLVMGVRVIDPIPGSNRWNVLRIGYQIF